MTSAPLVTRFAPSPTGQLHLGNARTALLSWLAARKSGGRFILRVEDTDQARSSEALVQGLLEDLRWLGLDWDEGPDVGGPHGEYRQQRRGAIYETWLAKLKAAGLTYACYCTPAELSVSRKLQLAAGKPPRYAGTCRELTLEQRAQREAQGLQPAIRFRVPAGQRVQFQDLVHGEQVFATDEIGDFIVQRADGSAAFFFSNALDDALMGVTLVLRGDDHMTNTPRQILVLQALGLAVPRYAHVALLLGMDGAPLSKRHGALGLRELRERGYLPGAVCNHLVRLGHTVGREGWLDEQALIAEFDLARLGRAPARFDEAQLRHWQKEAVAHLSEAAFQRWIGDDLPGDLAPERARAFAAAVRRNVEFPADVRPWVEVVFGSLSSYAPEALAAIREAGEDFFVEAAALLAPASMEARQVPARGESVAASGACKSTPVSVGGTSQLEAEVDFRAATRALSQRTGRKGPGLFMPLRAALTGAIHGPELAPLFALIPGEERCRRFARARELARA